MDELQVALDVLHDDCTDEQQLLWSLMVLQDVAPSRRFTARVVHMHFQNVDDFWIEIVPTRARSHSSSVQNARPWSYSSPEWQYPPGTLRSLVRVAWTPHIMDERKVSKSSSGGTREMLR